jgi:acyl-CoA reductase-like NAD-dependent aldehyde dehydrogenase
MNLKIINPATRTLVAQVPADTAASVKRKCELARAA